MHAASARKKSGGISDMAVSIDRENRIFTLHTKNTSYQMKADEMDVLIHTYYGARIDDSDLSQLVIHCGRGFSGNLYENGKGDRNYTLDVLPQEYSCFGTGDYRITALRVKNPDGSQACTLRYKKYELSQGKYSLDGLPAVYADPGEAETLSIWMEDPFSHLEVILRYGVLPELDIITREAEIVNRGGSPVVLKKAASMNLDIQYGDFDWLTFHGRHTMERNIQRTVLEHGVQAVGSVRGTSSHHYNPFAVLCEKNTDEDRGGCYGFSFLYSGEFLLETEKDQISQTRLICGIHPDDFSWTLEPGEAFQTPEVMMTYSGSGFGQMSRNFHKVIREHICRGEWKKKRRPVLINNWEGTYFNFTGDKLVSMAKDAGKLGIELFVMDDGWFGKRDDDNSGLGDWFPNEKKLGCTLKRLGERINEAGMQFGIWFEPEGISEDSDLFRAHSDWAVQIAGRRPDLSRNQLMLDISRKDVQDYIIERLCSILSEAPITYVKWDMNRSICDKYTKGLDADHQGEFSHRFVLGLYRILETLNQRFPHLLIEGCSGGGGRFDAGMLYYTPQIWCSDNTDAIGRLDIQRGTSYCYPVSTMGAHVSAVPNHQTGRVTPLQTRGRVAMAGTFGYELDLSSMTEKEKEEVKRQVEFFKKHYDLIQYGEYYRLRSPKDGCSVWEFVDEEGKEALVTAVYSYVISNSPFVNVKVHGLKPDAVYRVQLLKNEDTDPWFEQSELARDRILSGNALEQAGIVIPGAGKDYQSWQFYISLLEEQE